MSRRLLIVEPDASGRAMMERVLAADGYAIEAVASVFDARASLDAGSIDLAILDELGGKRNVLEEARWVRRAYPTLPIIVTGVLLSQRVLLELLRAKVTDALVKPFTPTELREATARALGQSARGHVEALEYDAASEAARRSLAIGALTDARPGLLRAQAASPLDSEVMALWAFVAEVEGRDADADRAYRAALALREGEDVAPPDPNEGLARLSAYRGARPVTSLSSARADSALWLITDPIEELRRGPPDAGAAGTYIAFMGVGLAASSAGALFLREGEGPVAFAVMAGALVPSLAASALAGLPHRSIVAHDATLARIDRDQLSAFVPRKDEP